MLRSIKIIFIPNNLHIKVFLYINSGINLFLSTSHWYISGSTPRFFSSSAMRWFFCFQNSALFLNKDMTFFVYILCKCFLLLVSFGVDVLWILFCLVPAVVFFFHVFFSFLCCQSSHIWFPLHSFRIFFLICSIFLVSDASDFFYFLFVFFSSFFHLFGWWGEFFVIMDVFDVFLFCLRFSFGLFPIFCSPCHSCSSHFCLYRLCFLFCCRCFLFCLLFLFLLLSLFFFFYQYGFLFLCVIFLVAPYFSVFLVFFLIVISILSLKMYPNNLIFTIVLFWLLISW